MPWLPSDTFFSATDECCWAPKIACLVYTARRNVFGSTYEYVWCPGNTWWRLWSSPSIYFANTTFPVIGVRSFQSFPTIVKMRLEIKKGERSSSRLLAVVTKIWTTPAYIILLTQLNQFIQFRGVIISKNIISPINSVYTLCRNCRWTEQVLIELTPKSPMQSANCKRKKK